MVRLNQYTKIFRGKTVLNNIDWCVSKGECIGILGRNASGKTMLLRAMAGLILPTSGTVAVNGQTIKQGESVWFLWADSVRKKTGVYCCYRKPHTRRPWGLWSSDRDWERSDWSFHWFNSAVNSIPGQRSFEFTQGYRGMHSNLMRKPKKTWRIFYVKVFGALTFFFWLSIVIPMTNLLSRRVTETFESDRESRLVKRDDEKNGEDGLWREELNESVGSYVDARYSMEVWSYFARFGLWGLDKSRW